MIFPKKIFLYYFYSCTIYKQCQPKLAVGSPRFCIMAHLYITVFLIHISNEVTQKSRLTNRYIPDA